MSNLYCQAIKKMFTIAALSVLCAYIGLSSVSVAHAAPAPAKPTLYGPYWPDGAPRDPNNLIRDYPWLWGVHIDHIAGYGLHYQFDWGSGIYSNFWFPYDNGMPTPTHTWYVGGYYTVRVRACCYDRSSGADCSAWSAWDTRSITVYPFGNIQKQDD